MTFLKNPLSLSILSGVLLTLSWPVVGLSMLVFVGLVPLLFLEDSEDGKDGTRSSSEDEGRGEGSLV